MTSHNWTNGAIADRIHANAYYYHYTSLLHYDISKWATAHNAATRVHAGETGKRGEQTTIASSARTATQPNTPHWSTLPNICHLPVKSASIGADMSVHRAKRAETLFWASAKHHWANVHGYPESRPKTPLVCSLNAQRLVISGLGAKPGVEWPGISCTL